MLSTFPGRRVYLGRAPQDMRRGMDALSAVVRNEFGRDPMSGDIFVFLSRDRRRLKVLVYEPGGYWLGMKRLDRGTFTRISSTRLYSRGDFNLVCWDLRKKMALSK